ncbi:MAG: group II intron reverse transcriptase/maturase [Phycisphaerae bacterium]|nr:group II intron reverse transcriptase/maturase [Phycisphaerae bacterium]NIX27758.1 group II intron reverse transcriptase/maturase [Phycisphaerae bacterium]
MTPRLVGVVHSSTSLPTWRSIDWDKAWREVRRLQMRIAKALAVKRVTSNKGKNTPGVDGVVWKGARAKMQAAFSLRQHGYKAQPLRRVSIPKKNGKKRPLSIPTMYDRAMQALYNLALAPVAETTADRNSYGFREGRSCADAVAAAFNALSKPNSATWVLEGDITGCFDNISNDWLMANIPIEKRILRRWLQAGYVEKGITFPTRKGAPQGGIISPCLANMTLDGLEEVILRAVPRRSRVNFIRYADDFIITGKSKYILLMYVLPAVKQFLAERGLQLSEEKTKLTYIRHGFTFLGQTFRKSGHTLRITPAKQGVLALIRKVGMLIRKLTSAPIVILIKKLNEVLRGWANYHRYVVATEAFERVDNYVYEQLWRMLRKRHPKKSRKWLFRKYWTAADKKGVFAAVTRYKTNSKVYHVIRTGAIGIRRHRKIKADANPYSPEYARYFWTRRRDREAKLMRELSHRQMKLAL